MFHFYDDALRPLIYHTSYHIKISANHYIDDDLDHDDDIHQ